MYRSIVCNQADETDILSRNKFTVKVNFFSRGTNKKNNSEVPI